MFLGDAITGLHATVLTVLDRRSGGLRGIMAPTPPKSEGEIVEVVYRWCKRLRQLENHPGYCMYVHLKVMAIKKLMVGRAKDLYEDWVDTIIKEDKKGHMDSIGQQSPILCIKEKARS